MKMKKFFSGILAAVMSLAVVAMPITGFADDPPKVGDEKIEKGTITIKNAASTGTYTAYPIFVGNVEFDTDTNKKVIDNPTFHANLETVTNSTQTNNIGPMDKSQKNYRYALWDYLGNGSSGLINVNGEKLTFASLIAKYDPNHGFSGFTITNYATIFAPQEAERLANILNLTSTSDKGAVDTIIDGSKNDANKPHTSAFYSAFAEAARWCMIDNLDAPKDLTGTADGTYDAEKKQVTIQVDEPGYYLVEYKPDDYMVKVQDKDEKGNPKVDKNGNPVWVEDSEGNPVEVVNEKYTNYPRAVRRSLVLVGNKTLVYNAQGKWDVKEDLSATIASKDTKNIATVDVQFNETMLKQTTADGKTAYDYDGAEGDWSKNVSAGNGDYVNCRVVVTLPGNLADYDQYYLAVPIMYGYNATADFDKVKSITRQGSDTENVKVYFLDDENKTVIDNSNFDIPASYTYADNSDTNTGGITVKQDYFVATETFVFTDVANMLVDKQTVKELGYNKLVIEFPVKFDRFSESATSASLSAGAATGVSQPGFHGQSTSLSNFVGDDALMKNYITVKAVYSNNPNLHVPTDDDYDIVKDEQTDEVISKTLKPGIHLYLDTSKEIGTLQNPVGVTQTTSSANIVTYRLRVHATTEDLFELSQAGGIEGVQFVLKDNKSNKYATITQLGTSPIATYDTVSGEVLKDGKGPYTGDNAGKVNVYKIDGWVDSYIKTEGEGENRTEKYDGNCVLKTANADPNNGVWKNNHTGRFEIVGLAPGDYTVIALDKTIKTPDVYEPNPSDSNSKVYALPKENNNPKTDYRFSFAPTLSETCTKLSYITHFAPIIATEKDESGSVTAWGWDSTGSYASTQSLSTSFGKNANPQHSIISATDVLITNFNMKWYAKNDKGEFVDATNPDWWLGQREDVGLMSMRVTYIKKGLSLPVTGGIGTFIFFAVGGALVVISTVAIVTKFRMKREQL